MTLPQAIPHVLAGERIHRLAWTDGKTWGAEGAPRQAFTYHANGTQTPNWPSTREDSLADDWAVVETPPAE